MKILTVDFIYLSKTISMKLELLMCMLSAKKITGSSDFSDVWMTFGQTAKKTAKKRVKQTLAPPRGSPLSFFIHLPLKNLHFLFKKSKKRIKSTKRCRPLIDGVLWWPSKVCRVSFFSKKSTGQMDGRTDGRFKHAKHEKIIQKNNFWFFQRKKSQPAYFFAPCSTKCKWPIGWPIKLRQE